MLVKQFNLLKNRVPTLFSDLVRGSFDMFQYRKDANQRPVLVIPGFTANDHSTAILRLALNASGLKSYTWEHGVNLIACNDLLNSLQNRLHEIYNETNQPVTIIGWSMGGYYARELAWRDPDMVNSVITLGTPIKRSVDTEGLRSMYNRIGIDIDDYPVDAVVFENIKKLPKVPYSSIYSDYDIIAPAEECLEVETSTSENIKAKTGHFGMVCDPAAINIIINRCLQSKSTWTKYNDN